MKCIRNFLKKNIKLLIGIIIGVMISGVGVYGAIIMSGDEISFDNSSANLEIDGVPVTNMQEAVDALYEKVKYAGSASYYLVSHVEGLENVADAYRYVGANPDNYVWFNNEQWRIIGVYGYNLKIIKATPSTTSQVYNSSTSSNNWSGSTMQTTYLYNTYYPTLSNEAKEMIEENEIWNVGKCIHDISSSDAYICAKTTLWTGKIGLISSYEYLYAAESSCWTMSGYYYNNGCSEKDWLFSTLSNNGSNHAWTLTSHLNNSEVSLYIGSASGRFLTTSVNASYAASPVVYLKSTVKITGGNGKIGEINSYKLG